MSADEREKRWKTGEAPDVEAHRLRGRGEEPNKDAEKDDEADVEAHMIRHRAGDGATGDDREKRGF